MFNRQPFNRGKFNRSTVAASSVLLYGEISLELEAAGKVNVSNTFEGNAALELTATGKVTYSANLEGHTDIILIADGQVIRSRAIEGNADIGIIVAGNIVRYRNLDGDALLTITASSEGFNTFRYEMISISRPGFLFRVGDEIIIDMENMNVIQNGQNIMRFVDRESEFFNLNPGNNEITYESMVTAGRVDLRILWKDAWL